ncbi:carboxyl transferase domain-containing protein [Nonomuraea thailandensis]
MWDPELAELKRRRELAERMGGEERVARQHATGRLTVRERLAALTDSWQEIGALTGRASDGGFTPSNVIIGRARLDGRRIVVAGDDFTVRGGAADAAIHDKQILAERMAGELRVPLVRLIDGTGGGGSVKQLEEHGRTYVPHNPGWDQVVANLGRIPVIALALGPVAGLGAARLVTSHVSIMVKELSQVFIAGPAVVEAGMGESVSKEELGGWRTVSAAGTVDLVAGSEQEAFELARKVLAYLPQSAWQPPPVLREPRDDPGRVAPELREIVPRDRRRPYDMRRILELVFDTGTVLELGRRFAPSIVTALARLDGCPVAVLASDPRVYGAA